MAQIVLKQCHFCEELFPPDKVKEVLLDRRPSSSYEKVYSCEECLNKSRIERLAEQAAKILEVCSPNNEVELSRGGLKVRFVRHTPSPIITKE